MTIRTLYHIQGMLGLTHVEAMAALVLGVALIGGGIADWALSHAKPADYAATDAVFAALVSARQSQSDSAGEIKAVAVTEPADSTGAEGNSTGSEAESSERSSPRRSTSSARPAPHSININTASAGELTRLPGIGPVLADRIVEDRSVSGSYQRPADLIRVKGIGEKTFQKMEPYVTL